MQPKEPTSEDYMELKEQLRLYKKAIADIVEEYEDREDWLGQDGQDARFAMHLVGQINEKVNSPSK